MIKMIYDAKKNNELSWLQGVLPAGITAAAVEMIAMLHDITEIGRSMQPSQSDIDKFCLACKKIHWLFVMTWPPSFTGGFYFHTMGNHAGRYMRYWGTMGRDSNTSFEKNQKVANESATHTQFGGGWGSRFVLPDGTETRVFQTAVRGIMERHNRVLCYECLPHCDIEFLNTNTQAAEVDALWKGRIHEAVATGGSGAPVPAAGRAAATRTSQAAACPAAHGGVGDGVGIDDNAAAAAAAGAPAAADLAAGPSTRYASSLPANGQPAQPQRKSRKTSQQSSKAAKKANAVAKTTKTKKTGRARMKAVQPVLPVSTEDKEQPAPTSPAPGAKRPKSARTPGSATPSRNKSRRTLRSELLAQEAEEESPARQLNLEDLDGADDIAA
jgi:hypothetical protein